ncbi:hypothetical protein XI04_18660 [Bradyrhizobium sp. CCBAU 11430]|uniref:hypothetical protein n=1 Tax=Bradyrhizobium sp. CCBAU 11430 TaxID=1630881 RepID=UPI002305F4D2|nr:hypothetical protein [Bradyrhizobium sp. CCBAU 11430]MDA9515065.1 hypothetical protein [Bradyrhizobium sp. CCBAU 11430]
MNIKRSKQPKAPPREPEAMSEDDLVKAQITSGVASGRKLNARLEQALGIPYAYLTEHQWNEIQSKTKFRTSARFELNIALRRYWTERLDKSAAPNAKKEITESRSKLEAARQSLLKLIIQEDVFKGRVAHCQISPLEQRKELEAFCERISGADIILASLEKRHTRGRGQPSYGPVYDLIHHLDYIFYAQHGQRITRSEKRMIRDDPATVTSKHYVWMMMQIADRQIAEATVDTVLRDYIMDRDKHDRPFPKRMI